MPEGVNTKLWNVATDLAINSHLNHLPEGGLIPGEPGTPFEHLPKGKTAEWYLENMPEFNDGGNGQNGEETGSESPGDGSSNGPPGQGDKEPSEGIPDSLDDHSGWGKCSQEVKDIAKERVKDIIRKSAEEASKSSNWGSVSHSCRERIMKALNTKVDWKSVLRYFVKTSQKANKSSSMKRINRRYPYIHSGRKSNRVANVAVSIDQSGSVSDEMLSKFFAELNKLSDIAEFTVIPFDTRVDESLIYKWKKGQSRQTERVLFGGTCFDAPTEYVNKNSFDGHIVLTDMCAPKPRPSKCQRMWMTTAEHADRQYFNTKEKVITID